MHMPARLFLALVAAACAAWPDTLTATPNVLVSDGILDAAATTIIVACANGTKFAQPAKHQVLECALHPDAVGHRVPGRWLNATAVSCNFAPYLAARPSRLNMEISLFLDGNESYVAPYQRASINSSLASVCL